MKKYSGNYGAKTKYCVELKESTGLEDAEDLQERIKKIVELPFSDKKNRTPQPVYLWCRLKTGIEKVYFLNAEVKQHTHSFLFRSNLTAVFTLWEYEYQECLLMELPAEVWTSQIPAAAQELKRVQEIYESLLPFDRSRFGFVLGGGEHLDDGQENDHLFDYCNGRIRKPDHEREPYYRAAGDYLACRPNRMACFTAWLHNIWEKPETELERNCRKLFVRTLERTPAAQLAQDILLASFGYAYNITALRPDTDTFDGWQNGRL